MYAERLDDKYPCIWFLHQDDDSSQVVDFYLDVLDLSSRGRYNTLFEHLCTQNPPFSRTKYVDLSGGYAELKTPNYRMIAKRTGKGWVVGYGFKKPKKKKQDLEIQRGIDILADFKDKEANYRG